VEKTRRVDKAFMSHVEPAQLLFSFSKNLFIYKKGF